MPLVVVAAALMDPMEFLVDQVAAAAAALAAALVQVGLVPLAKVMPAAPACLVIHMHLVAGAAALAALEIQQAAMVVVLVVLGQHHQLVVQR